jgi:hypothetical protein
MQEEDKKVKTFEEIYFQMAETKQKNARVNAYGADIDLDTGLPRANPSGSTTPTKSTTPKGVYSGLSTTPRGKSNLPVTPTKMANADGTFSFNVKSIFSNNELPVEEFDDFLTNMDSIPN